MKNVNGQIVSKLAQALSSSTLCLALINYEIKNIHSVIVVSDDYLTEQESFNLKLLRIFNFICLLSSTINCIYCSGNKPAYSEILDYLKAIRLR